MTRLQSIDDVRANAQRTPPPWSIRDHVISPEHGLDRVKISVQCGPLGSFNRPDGVLAAAAPDLLAAATQIVAALVSPNVTDGELPALLGHIPGCGDLIPAIIAARAAIAKAEGRS